MPQRIPIAEKTKLEILGRANNRCCVCQTPFVHFHHLDGDPTNNDVENIVPLCPNCHGQAHSQSTMTTNLTPNRLRALRDRWYAYCDKRKEGSSIGANALLRLQNLVNSLGLADHSWKKMFALVDPRYANMSRDQIINHVFSTSNRDDLAAALDTVKNMYGSKWDDPDLLRKFKLVCNAFGFEYEEL